MRKKISYLLEYREDGEHKEIDIEIDFISNRVIKDYSDLILLAGEVEKAHNRISDIYTILASEKLTDKEIEDYKKEEENCLATILKFNDNGYFEKRFEILKRILIDNGYKNDKKLMSFDFWDESVDPFNLLEFMSKSVYKDIDNKKKLLKE